MAVQDSVLIEDTESARTCDEFLSQCRDDYLDAHRRSFPGLDSWEAKLHRKLLIYKLDKRTEKIIEANKGSVSVRTEDVSFWHTDFHWLPIFACTILDIVVIALSFISSAMTGAPAESACSNLSLTLIGITLGVCIERMSSYLSSDEHIVFPRKYRKCLYDIALRYEKIDGVKVVLDMEEPRKRYRTTDTLRIYVEEEPF